VPLGVFQQRCALGEPAGDREDEGHGHVGRVLGQHARRVGDDDAAHARGVEIDVVHAVAEIGDQLQLRAGLGQQGAIDPVRHGRHQDVRRLDRLGELGMAHGSVGDVEARVEQLAHARLDRIRKLARDDDERFFRRHCGRKPFGQALITGVRPVLTDGPTRSRLGGD
jgi:hypothetical protein